METQAPTAHVIEEIEIIASDPLEGIGDTTGVDEDASIERYGDMLEERLGTDYPGASLKVRVERTYGSGVRTFVFCNDPEHVGRCQPGTEDVEEAALAVWNDMEGGWIVETVSAEA